MAAGSELELSVVIPTFNEAENIPVLLKRLAGALGGVRHEIIVADDDSPDKTWQVVEKIAAARLGLRCLRRTRDKGLYPAVLDAFDSAQGKYLAVIDADLQHDESLLPRMIEAARERGLQLVMGSRYTEGGGVADWGLTRRLISRMGTQLASLVLEVKVSDPMSGFFLLERDAYHAIKARLSPKGFKILMDILHNLPPGAEVGELGYVFAVRERGESKLSGEVGLQFLAALLKMAAARLFSR